MAKDNITYPSLITKKLLFDSYIGVEGEVTPLPTDLNTYHKTITDNTFAESINNLPAKFLPRVAEFNGVDDYLSFPQKSFEVATYCFEIKKTAPITMTLLGRTSASANYIYIHGAGKLYFETTVGGVINQFDYIFSDNIKYNIIITVDSSNNFNLFVNSIFQQTINVVATNAILLSQLGYRALNPFIGNITRFEIYERVLTQIEINAFSTNDTIVNTNLYFKFILLGFGAYEYDLSGNNRHLRWLGTGNRFAYDSEGSNYLNKNGYSLWQHAILEDIQVPFDINGNALVLNVGTDIPTGYTKTYDVIAGGATWNLQDALIDFENSGEAAIEIFNRSNTTIQTAASRSSVFYDATHPYRYHISEIINYDIYKTFFNSAYLDVIFAKILKENNNIIRLDEVLNYDEQKTGEELAIIKNYCGI